MKQEARLQTPAPAAVGQSRVGIANLSLHHIVIGGGGAAGLELATKLGDRLGRRKKAKITLVERARAHIWKPHLHEVAAGTMDIGREAVDYPAQAADHCFRYLIGEMIGLDRSRREVHVAASIDAEGHEITPARSVPYDTLVIDLDGLHKRGFEWSRTVRTTFEAVHLGHTQSVPAIRQVGSAA